MTDDNDTNEDFDDGLEVDDEGNVLGKVDTLRDLRKQAKEGREARALRAENAMLRAGIDLDSERGKFFANAYDGDLDPQAIKDSYSAIFPTSAEPEAEAEMPEPENPDTELSAEAQSHLRDMADLGAPAQPNPEAEGDVYEGALERARGARAQGASNEAAIGSFVNEIVNEAAGGNPQTRLTPQGTRPRRNL